MPDRALPVIAVLATGGTIAGAQADATSAGYKAGSFSVGDLLAAVPQLAGIADIRAEQIANVGSQNMTHGVWRALATRVEALCQDASVAGIVIFFALSLVSHLLLRRWHESAIVREV